LKIWKYLSKRRSKRERDRGKEGKNNGKVLTINLMTCNLTHVLADPSNTEMEQDRDRARQRWSKMEGQREGMALITLVTCNI